MRRPRTAPRPTPTDRPTPRPALGIIVGVTAAFLARLGQQFVSSRRAARLVGFRVKPAHPLGQRYLFMPEMAFLVLAAGPAPARLVAAEVGARRGPMRSRSATIGSPARRRHGASTTNRARCRRVGGEAGQIGERQRPVRIHRFGGQHSGSASSTSPVRSSAVARGQRLPPAPGAGLSAPVFGRTCPARPPRCGRWRPSRYQSSARAGRQPRPRVTDQIDEPVDLVARLALGSGR